jgi:cytochrome b561
MKKYLFNFSSHYGWVSIILHWSMALLLVGMYLLGDYMVDLDYYDDWYHKAPAFHKSIGVVLGLALIFRIVWNYAQCKPIPYEDNLILITLAKLAHLAIYVLIVLLLISGYLISTAKGQGINVFYLFELPALLANNSARGEIAGNIHATTGIIFILIVVLHAIAGFIHHFVFKDRTLTRILWVKK